MIVAGPCVIVSAAVCRRLEAPLVKALAEARGRGERVDLDTADVIAQIRAVAASARGEVLPRAEASEVAGVVVDESVGCDDWLDTDTAAERMGCTPRGARWLAQRHGLGRKVRGRWLYDPADVDAYSARNGVVTWMQESMSPRSA